ncbi:hypothetical protein HFO49_35695 [Rhizobium leguminosarum]|uniref:hypothetical protein n=1 Tax=Rhizobium leguminosarum TaxID=384 RepID=UPI001C947220|nr:hypothetical protein [Rhizobium leguminosarum]MBY5592694.1 hypothetical protein [Rhizobium leguminosarum]MBY5605576.1 hypothetical protein [Rhizobium leguminosarum]
MAGLEMTRRHSAADINEIQKRLTSRATASLAEDPNADIADLLRRIEELNKLKSLLSPNLLMRLLAPLSVGALCLAFLAITLVVRVDAIGLRTPVALDVTAQSVTFVADSDWLQESPINLTAGHFRADRFAVSFSDPAKAFETLSTRQWLEANGGNLVLHSLSVRKGSQATVDTSESGQTAIYGTGLRGEIHANGQTTLRWSGPNREMVTGGLDLEGQPPEIFSLATAADGPPGRLAFVPKASITIRDLSISALSFGREMQIAPADPRFTSTITAGTLRLPSVDRDIDLSTDRAITFTGLVGRIDSLVVDHKISLRFDGDAKKVLVGSGNGQSDLTPSILAYLYRNQIVTFLFASFTFTWGALWSLTRLVFA